MRIGRIEMQILTETLLKLEILTRGVTFTDKALQKAHVDGAKRQNRVYNQPVIGGYSRPQELFIEGEGGYITVASCVSPTIPSKSVFIDVDSKGNLFASVENELFSDVHIEYVKEPAYYSKSIDENEIAKQYVSACGYDELNIIPWRGCAISDGCKFCGINTVSLKGDQTYLTAFDLSKSPEHWEQRKSRYLHQLNKSIGIAITDPCYSEHAHVILISGNLSNSCLDLQADIYSEIAQNITDSLGTRATEGIVAVTAPPKSIEKLKKMKQSGIQVVVFNLEVGNDPWFSKYCPGKSVLGRDFFLERLNAAVKIFGKGNVWSNFVLGLEPVNKLLELCRSLATNGIVCGANILHMDKGNRLDCNVPCKADIIKFYCELSSIYKEYDFKPYYCAKALRTSIINEVYDGRILGLEL